MAGRLIFAFLLALYLLTGGGKGYSIDGAFGYEMAKTAFLDPEHTYFRRFKTAFARWGALMPLLGQPFVLAGDALSRLAPERDHLEVDGHTFRVEEWPAAARPPAPGADLPLPPAREYRAVAVVSFLSNSLQTPNGTVVGQVALSDGTQQVRLPVEAGNHTAEWAIDRPDVAGRALHARARVAGHWIGQPRGNLYFARIALPAPMRVARWELLGAPTDATWHVRAVAFEDVDGSWHDVHTGERFWSARQTRDFFTRLVYSTLNAFVTAGAGLLVYRVVGLLGYAGPVQILSALGYGLGTMAWPYAKLDFSEPAATLFTLCAVWALYRAFPPQGGAFPPQGGAVPGNATALGLLAGGGLLLAAAGKYTAALAAAAVLLQWAASAPWWQPQQRGRALRFLAALVLPALTLGAAAVGLASAFTGEVPIVFRDVWSRLFEDWLALPPWIGLRGLLFSPGKSLFLYSPWLLLAVAGAFGLLRRHGRHGLLFTLYPVVVVALYSMKPVWHGGGWGPRYLLPIVPFLAVAAAPAVEWCLGRGRPARLALAALAAVSLGVQALAVAKDPEQYPSMVREFVVPALPDYGSRLGGRDYWIARGGEGLARALLDPASGGKRRGLGYVWGYPDAEVLVEFGAARTVDLSLYFVDWDAQQRRQLVTVRDAAGERRFVMDRDFAGGVWATWEVTGSPEQPVRVSLAQRGPDTSVVSAAAFDPARVGRRDQPVLDERTRGDWPGRYGADGYVLFAWHSFNIDLARLPPYVRGYVPTHVGDKPDPRIHVEIPQQDLLDTPLLYAAPFSPLLGNAWLLAADLVHLVIPSRPDLAQAILLRPPWTWFGIRAPLPERPEYGLGLDAWLALLYNNYRSHPGVLGWAWATAGLLSLAVTGTGTALFAQVFPGRPRARLLFALSCAGALALYLWLGVRA